LKENIRQSGFDPEVIVGIHTVGYGGGGLVGDVLASHLHRPMLTACAELRDSDRKAHVYKISDELIRGKRVLLVDDVCTTGGTLRDVKNDLETTYDCKELKVAVIVKPTLKLPLPLKIDFWAFETPYYVLDREWRIQPPRKQ
jgi:hypoxanthine phosphoribosyltransferase